MNVLNIVGYSQFFSQTLRILFASLPNPPTVPQFIERNGGDISSGLQPFITIAWEEPYEKGGVPILGYLVSFSEDGGEWTLAYDGSANFMQKMFKF
jgi:hypothetical protein